MCRNLEDKNKAKKLVEDYDSRYGKVRLCELTLFLQCLNNWICLQKGGFPREEKVVKYVALRKTSDSMNRKKNHTISALWLVCIVACCKIKVSLCKKHKHVIPATTFLFFLSVWNRFSLALFAIATGPMYLVKNPVWVPSHQQCLAYNFLKSFAVLGTSFRLLSFQIHIRFLLIVHTFHHPPLVTQIDSVLRLNIMKSPGCNAWRDEPMCVCRNDRCVDAK